MRHCNLPGSIDTFQLRKITFPRYFLTFVVTFHVFHGYLKYCKLFLLLTKFSTGWILSGNPGNDQTNITGSSKVNQFTTSVDMEWHLVF